MGIHRFGRCIVDCVVRNKTAQRSTNQTSLPEDVQKTVQEQTMLHFGRHDYHPTNLENIIILSSKGGILRYKVN
jgi:hypothetical protein